MKKTISADDINPATNLFLSPLFMGFRVLLFFTLLAVLFGCSRTKIAHEVNPEADFSKMKTYAWVPTKLEGTAEGLSVEYIEKAITSYLELKGFTLTSGNPDFLVSARIKMQEIITDLRGTGMYSGADASLS